VVPPRISCTISHLYSETLDVVVGPSPAAPGYRIFGDTLGPIYARSCKQISENSPSTQSGE
jgi:hypothetical protein